MRSIFLVFLAIFLFATSGCSNYGKVEGTVLDKRTNKPVDGAIVTVKGTTLACITDLGGEFTIKEIPPGLQKIVANKEGFLSPGEAELAVTKGTTVTSLNLFVIPKPDIIGNWSDAYNREQFEFFKDNTYMTKTLGILLT